LKEVLRAIGVGESGQMAILIAGIAKIPLSQLALVQV